MNGLFDGWQAWHVVALAAAFAGLIVLARFIRRSAKKTGQAFFLARFPDAARLYTTLKNGEDGTKLRVVAVNGARPCGFSDSAGRGVFVPSGDCAVAVGSGPAVTLEFRAGRYKAYILRENGAGRPEIAEIDI